MTQLPAEGRKGPAPAWPLPPDRELHNALTGAQTEAGLIEDDVAHEPDPELRHKLRRDWRRAAARVAIAESDLQISQAEELRLWATLWALPQAVAWERLGYLNEVAQYVRWKVRAELGELQASKESRLVGDRLGLTPAAMLHLRWEVVVDELAAKREEQPPAAAAGSRRRAAARKPAAKSDPRASLVM